MAESKLFRFKQWYKKREEHPIEKPKWALFFVSVNTIAPFIFSLLGLLFVTIFQWTPRPIESKILFSGIIFFMLIFSFISALRLDKCIKVRGEERVYRYRTWYIETHHIKIIKSLKIIRYMGYILNLTMCVLVIVL